MKRILLATLLGFSANALGCDMQWPYVGVSAHVIDAKLGNKKHHNFRRRVGAQTAFIGMPIGEWPVAVEAGFTVLNRNKTWIRHADLLLGGPLSEAVKLDLVVGIGHMKHTGNSLRPLRKHSVKKCGLRLGGKVWYKLNQNWNVRVGFSHQHGTDTIKRVHALGGDLAYNF